MIHDSDRIRLSGGLHSVYSCCYNEAKVYYYYMPATNNY